MKTCRKFSNLFKYLSTFHEDLTMMLLPAISNSHKSVLLECNGIRLLAWTRRYKYYANALSCYVLRKVPTLFSWYTVLYSECQLHSQVLYVYVFNSLLPKGICARLRRAEKKCSPEQKLIKLYVITGLQGSFTLSVLSKNYVTSAADKKK